VAARARVALDALEHLVSGLGTGILALVALLCLAGQEAGAGKVGYSTPETYWTTRTTWLE
ncbi:hypothetical protein, partial [Streptomyces hirsutus]|uniref:hypothetical protein n=1 Tax=Streptomyces hirsutus TaxID=35620 RepID=UPI003332A70B